MAAPFPARRVHDKSGWAISDPTAVRRRFIICAAILATIFLLLFVRLWFLQIVRGPELLAMAQNNRIKNVPLSAPRGLILDRHGAVLATSRTAHSVAVVPAALPSKYREREARARVLKTLGFLIGVSATQIETAIEEAAARQARLYDPVRIGGNLDLKTLTRLEENRARLGPAVLITEDVSRNYPNGALASHVLGYSDIVSEKDLARDAEAEEPRDLKYDDIVGKIGLEKQYDRELSGVRGSERYEVDARGRPVARRGSIPQKPGNTLVLTLDAKLQKAAEEALSKARNTGAAVAIDPRNGEILAMASFPNFNPNVWSLPKKAKQRAFFTLSQNPKNPLINRAAGGRFPPASTFKAITASAGLERGTLDPRTTYPCNGGLRLGRFFGCWKVHANENVYGALANSCDTYFYQEALRLGNPEASGPTWLAKVARDFGLGSPTGVDFPVDNKGLVPDPAWRRRVNAGNPDLARWYPGNTLNMSIGQGDLLTTPLQMAVAIGAVANGGTLWQPRFLKEMRDAKTDRLLKATKPKSRGDVKVGSANLAIVRAGLRRVITNGTGKGVALPNVAIAGKTGSAEDANNALPHAWFVAFAPYDKPRIAIAVIVENAGHGSENAGPIAKKILEAAFPMPKKVQS
ncbi:MAG TPA: penicillin-binding protein 2 [Abditibacteriaceae bacterium]|jgi:penicillin-binding protein 2